MKRPCDEVSWFPPWVDPDRLVERSLEIHPRTSATSPWRYRRPEDGYWGDLCEGLIARGAHLRDLDTDTIIKALDTAANAWLDRRWPPRILARDASVRATGFAPEVVDQSFDVELANYRGDSLRRALVRELGNPSALDGPVPDQWLGGETFALGPRLTVAITSGNVPALPALSIVRTLLVKSPLVLKVASGEPTFASRFAMTLHEIDPRLGNVLAVTYWSGEDVAALERVLSHASAVIVYGDREACESVRSRTGSGQRIVEHGPKLSLAVVEEAKLEESITGLAVDVSAFNQNACIAPRLVFAEGPRDAVEQYCAGLAAALAATAQTRPLGTIPAEEAAGLQLRRAEMRWNACDGTSGGVWQGKDLQFTVCLDNRVPNDAEALGYRTVVVVRVASADQVPAMLTGFAGRLQNVGLAVSEGNATRLALGLAQLGASRIAPVGQMHCPSLAWRHDGRMCLAELVHWCDTEMFEDSERCRSDRDTGPKGAT